MEQHFTRPFNNFCSRDNLMYKIQTTTQTLPDDYSNVYKEGVRIASTDCQLAIFLRRLAASRLRNMAS